jgi:hypothetical protein
MTMPRLAAIFETTRAAYRLPIWRTERSASMSHLSCFYSQGEDPLKWLPEQMPGLIEHLNLTPPEMRCLYPQWFGVWEYGGPNYDVVPTYDPAKSTAQMRYTADALAAAGFGPGSIPMCFCDHEIPDPKGFTNRSKFLRAATKPLRDAFGSERVNYTDATFKGSIVEWSGFRRLTGSTIDRTDSVDCYTHKPGDFVRVIRNVLACRKTGRVIPHLPPKITEHQDQAEAESQIRAMIHVCARVGITTFFVASYEWPEDKWPRLVEVVTNACAEAEAITTQEANA